MVINNALPQLPCNKYMVIRYTDLVARPQEFIEPISQLLGVPVAHMQNSFAGIKPRPHREDSPEVAKQRALLAGFFKHYEPLWPLLSGSASNH